MPAVTTIMADVVSHLPDESNPDFAGYYDVTQAALNRSCHFIAPARRGGLLKERLIFARGPFRLGLDSTELKEAGKIHDDRIGVELAAIGLLLPMYAIPQLATFGLRTVHDHAWWGASSAWIRPRRSISRRSKPNYRKPQHRQKQSPIRSNSPGRCRRSAAAELSARIGVHANVVAKRLRADNVPPAFIAAKGTPPKWPWPITSSTPSAAGCRSRRSSANWPKSRS